MFTDVFMFSGEELMPVELVLGQLSYNILKEEYPLSPMPAAEAACCAWTCAAMPASAASCSACMTTFRCSAATASGVI